MGIIIKHKRHYLTRLPIWFFVIVFAGLSPLIIGLTGAWVTEGITSETCHEGNCGWMALPWFVLYTMPLGALGLVIYFIVIIFDSIELSRSKN